ncbi:hypothetical protein BKA00_002396 [Actinomadura coerulea]|uniref:Uncharacterized protein n=1 Tax=Actinomadura coerulea TaxID=46159 RepID=A0A7X0FYK9_9ACTN|nr:hypothetical protein [Actinomadura coerulea]MBB6395482.1 hypothetical protein [Actinomadura coerulea]GGQ25968.1 hypothetical protein GCM10010187_48240 [Actinomadura coerulea]
MNYSELEADILRMVIEAAEDDVRAFGEDTVTRLVRPELLRGAADDELTGDARAALASASANVLTISAAELQDELATIHDGILVDDDLDTGVLTVIRALGHWQSYLEQGRRGELYELAIRSVEDVDHEVSADLGDFLAAPEMAAEYERIRRLLSPARARGASAP